MLYCPSHCQAGGDRGVPGVLPDTTSSITSSDTSNAVLDVLLQLPNLAPRYTLPSLRSFLHFFLLAILSLHLLNKVVAHHTNVIIILLFVHQRLQVSWRKIEEKARVKQSLPVPFAILKATIWLQEHVNRSLETETSYSSISVEQTSFLGLGEVSPYVQ